MSDRVLRRKSPARLVDAHVDLVSDASLGALERACQHEIDQLDTVSTASLARHAPHWRHHGRGTWAMSATGRWSTGTLPFGELRGSWPQVHQ